MFPVSSNPIAGVAFVAATLGLFGASAARSFAAESEGRVAPVVIRTPDDDSISVSKREFDAAKSSRDPALQQKGEVPRLSAPELSTGVSGFSGLPAIKPEATEKEKKSANWLVDAMEKKPSSSADRNKRRGLSEGDSERDRDPLRDGLARSSAEPRKDGAASRDSDSIDAKQNGEKNTTVVNPLDRYLSGWMSPGDYALLKPGLTENGRTASPGSSSAIPQISGAAALALPGTAATANLLPGATPVLAAPSAPKANPYLEILNGPAAAAAPIPAVTSTAPVVTPAPKVPVFVPPPAPIELPKSQLPDFVKPTQDEKYYKQLKRF